MDYILPFPGVVFNSFGRSSAESVSLYLMPFWSIEAIQGGVAETVYEKIYNVIGILLRLYFRKKAVTRSLMIGAVTSIWIELLQLITRTGTCETDDVICNTVGCVIGAGVVQLYKRFKI